MESNCELTTKVDILETILDTYLDNKNYVPHELWKLLYAAKAVCCTYRSVHDPVVSLPVGDSAPRIENPPLVIAPPLEGDSLLTDDSIPFPLILEEITASFKGSKDFVRELFINPHTRFDLKEQIW